MNLTSLDLSDRISNGVAAMSLIVAVIALIYARSQAKEAQRANEKADRANEIAREANRLSGEANSTSAAANRLSQEANSTSEQALEVSRLQLENERQARHQADAPVFRVAEAVTIEDGEFFAKVTLRQTGGVPLARAEVVVSGEYVRCLRADSDQDADVLSEPVIWREPSQDSEYYLNVELEHEHIRPVTMRIDVVSYAPDGRHWHTHVNAQPDPPVQPVRMTTYRMRPHSR